MTHPKEQILKQLSERRKYISEIAEHTGLTRQTVSQHLEELEEQDRVKQVDTIGQAKIYAQTEEG